MSCAVLHANRSVGADKSKSKSTIGSGFRNRMKRKSKTSLAYASDRGVIGFSLYSTGRLARMPAVTGGDRHVILDHPRHRILDHRKTILAVGGNTNPAGFKEEGCVRWMTSR